MPQHGKHSVSRRRSATPGCSRCDGSLSVTTRSRLLCRHTLAGSVDFQFEGVLFTAQVLNAKRLRRWHCARRIKRQSETLLKNGQFWVDKTGQALKPQPAPAALTLHQLVEIAEHELSLPPGRT